MTLPSQTCALCGAVWDPAHTEHVTLERTSVGEQCLSVRVTEHSGSEVVDTTSRR